MSQFTQSLTPQAAEYSAALVAEDDHDVVDNNHGEDDHGSLLSLMDDRSDSSDHSLSRNSSAHTSPGTSPNQAAVERARAASKSPSSRPKLDLLDICKGHA